MLVALIASVLGEVSYRWRRLPVGDTPVAAIALPTKGRRSFIANGSGFAIRDLTEADRIPMAEVTGVALGDYAPDTVVAVGRADAQGNIRFSLDGGKSWRPCPTPTSLEGGSVAVSSTGRTWVWSGPVGAKRTDDYGFTWTDCDGLPSGASVVADRTSAQQFYAVNGGRLYISTDGAKGFEARDLSIPGGEVLRQVVFTPGRVRDGWLLTSGKLYHSLPNRSSQSLPGVTDPVALSFGLARGGSAPGPLPLAMFLAARVDGRSGLFRSDDDGATWSHLTATPEGVRLLRGDPAHINRVYIAPSEGGVWVGDPR